MASANWPAAAVIAAATGRAYGRRITAEAAMLAETFATDYPAYAARTRRLIPFVY